MRINTTVTECGVPNEDKAGSLAPRTWGKWKDRILCLERILDCKALTWPKASVFKVLGFQEIKNLCLSVTQCTTSFFEKVLLSPSHALPPLKRSQLDKPVRSHVIDLHTGTSSVPRLASLADLNWYTDRTWRIPGLEYRFWGGVLFSRP